MNLEIRNFTKDKINKKLFLEVAEKTFKILSIKDKIEISLVFIGNGRMKKLNKIYRGKNQVTDVLAFPEGSYPKFIVPKNFRNFLGEIIICYPQAKKQAKEFGHSLFKELTILLIHAILHLVGYGDSPGKNRQRMETKQNEILSILENIKIKN